MCFPRMMFNKNKIGKGFLNQKFNLNQNGKALNQIQLIKGF